MTRPVVDELNESCVIKKTTDIWEDIPHPLHKLYCVTQSGCRCLSEGGWMMSQYFPDNFHQAAEHETGEGEVNGRGGVKQRGNKYELCSICDYNDYYYY